MEAEVARNEVNGESYVLFMLNKVRRDIIVSSCSVVGLEFAVAVDVFLQFLEVAIH